MKKLFIVFMTVVMVLSVTLLSGCGKTENTVADTGSEIESTVSETVETSDSTEQKPVVLVVSFGTSYNDTREKTIGAIENKIAEDYPEYEVRRAFTSQTIIDKLKKRDNLEIDNVEGAFERLVSDGVKKVVVQPTHLMSGYEYDDLTAVFDQYKSKFEKAAMGKPLLTSDEDLTKVASALPEITKDYNTEGTAVIFMGHGTEHDSNEVYVKLQEKLNAAEANNYYIGTVEASPSLDDMVSAAKEGGYSKVVLEPLMVVAGDHANNDMAGDEDDSWKSVFEKEGFEVECVLQGLGEFEEIQKIYSDHVGEAISSLN